VCHARDSTSNNEVNAIATITAGLSWRGNPNKWITFRNYPINCDCHLFTYDDFGHPKEAEEIKIRGPEDKLTLRVAKAFSFGNL